MLRFNKFIDPNFTDIEPMNFLGHAWLSFEDPQVLLGNMIGDHVKGKKALSRFPPGVARGILLHRRIDQFVDHHPASKRVKMIFRPDFGLYAGALIDVLFDHFLANDPACFHSLASLKSFSQKTYGLLNEQRAWFPPLFAQYFDRMVEDDWLSGYRRLDGVQRALRGLSYRAKYIPDTAMAYSLFIRHYHELNQAYLETIGPLSDDVKIQLVN